MASGDWYNRAMTQKPENATEQATPKPGKGGVVPPTSKQFGKPGGNPRHNGAWKKEDTPRFKLEQMMKLGEEELRKVAESKDAPLFERKLAIAIRKGEWREIKEMIQEVYGKPKESVDLTTGGEPMTALVEFKGE